MPITADQRRAVAHCLAHAIPFVVYAEPGDSNVTFYADDSVSQPLLHERFRVHGWRDRVVATIVPRLDEVSAPHSTLQPSSFTLSSPLPSSTPKETYIRSVREIITKRKANGGKTVFSRVETLEIAPESAITAIERLLSQPSPRMNCAWYTTETGAWLMSSPEVLMRCDKENYFTMALAGTRKIGSQGDWDNKNSEEQSLVTRYIVERLRSMGLKPDVSEPFTLPAGNIEHICQTITGKLGRQSPSMMASLLSPTPAVAGLPVYESLADIERLESQPRDCYAGFCEITREDVGEYQAWVVLRCARFTASKAVFYAGGGITGQSSAEKEWTETVAKLTPIRSLFL
ncbi:MAG: chorismate-binding protein [Bacteroidales bacterium]|nr:chorismate-binding protein [Bacteroidales bacterium]